MLFLERPRSPVNNFPDAMVSLFLWRTQKFSASLERDEFPGPDVTPGPLAKDYSASPLEIHLEGGNFGDSGTYKCEKRVT